MGDCVAFICLGRIKNEKGVGVSSVNGSYQGNIYISLEQLFLDVICFLLLFFFFNFLYKLIGLYSITKKRPDNFQIALNPLKLKNFDVYQFHSAYFRSPKLYAPPKNEIHCHVLYFYE